jgi:excisionase family DNA binding protein
VPTSAVASPPRGSKPSRHSRTGEPPSDIQALIEGFLKCKLRSLAATVRLPFQPSALLLTSQPDSKGTFLGYCQAWQDRRGAHASFSPFPKTSLRTRDLGQYSLPYPVEAEELRDRNETERGIDSRREDSGEKISQPQPLQIRQPRTPTHKNGRRKPPAKATVPTHSKLLVRREEAAEVLSISVRSVDYLIANKHLIFRRIGGRVLIPIAELQRFARMDHPERIAC